MKKIALLLVVAVLLAGASFAAFDKKVTFPAKTMAQVTFDHGFHLSQAGINCKTCHPKIIAKTKAGANKIKMADINKGKFCGVCHTAKINAKANPTAVQAFAPKGNCAKCHVKSEG